MKRIIESRNHYFFRIWNDIMIVQPKMNMNVLFTVTLHQLFHIIIAKSLQIHVLTWNYTSWAMQPNYQLFWLMRYVNILITMIGTNGYVWRQSIRFMFVWINADVWCSSSQPKYPTKSWLKIFILRQAIFFNINTLNHNFASGYFCRNLKNATVSTYSHL